MNNYFCLLYFVTFILFTFAFDDSDIAENIKQIENYGVYFSLNSTLECYRPYYKLPVIQVLLKEMTERYPDIGYVDNHHKNHPFIGVEGVHRKTRNIVSHLLARKMGADVVYNPPQFMTQISTNFTDPNLKKAFFGLAGYGAACNARYITKTVPAIVAGHWMAQAAFAITKVYDTIPPPESKIYTWPADLYMPDIIFFINTHRQSRRREPKTVDNEFLPKFINVFRNWRYPPVIEINSTYLYEEIATKMLEIVNKEFQGNY